MKRFLISNVLLVFIVVIFFQFNGSIFSSIYFSPTQSFFTRLDYLMIGLVGAIMFYLLLYVVKKMNIGTQKKRFRVIVQYEIFLLFLVFSAACLVYAYTVFWPNTFFYKGVVLWYEIEFKYISVLYFLELLTFLGLSIGWYRKSQVIR